VNPRTVLRERTDGTAPQVTNMELFFDLVYVFAITQLSDFLGHHLSARGTLQALVLFAAVWWAWNYTAWATNWIDPDRWRVALLMIVLMGISLVMSSAIPEAFESRGLAFAAAYVSIQVIRSAFMVLALKDRTMGRNYAQLLAWSVISGVVWIAGALAHGDTRLLLWIGALVLDLGAPLHGFRLPGIPGTPIEAWTLAGGHLAERCQLVLLIALGESILRVGATFGAEHERVTVDTAFLVGFAGTVSMWAIYFLHHAEEAARSMALATSATARMGRSGYAYAHAVMVAGVIVVAVGTRLTISDPEGSATTAVAATVLGGPAIYLAGQTLFKRSVTGERPLPPLMGICVLALLTPLALAVDRLALATGATAVLFVLAISAGRRQSTTAKA
jgi:low temperature requirement protein LtrA